MDSFFQLKISNMLSRGYSLKEISNKLNLKYNTLTINYNPKTKDSKWIGYKDESYYSNEWDYALTPTYSWKSLSKSEKKFYIDNKIFKKNNNE